MIDFEKILAAKGKNKKIAPYKALEEKDEEIIRLNYEITKLKEAGR